MTHESSQRLRCPLPARFAAPEPRGLRVTTWDKRHARDVHALIRDAYAQGAGEIDAYETWVRDFEGDHEFEAASCFLAFREARLVGVALSWTSGFLKDLAVDASERNGGVGTFLLRRVCDHFEARGVAAVDLKVERANQAAMRLYRRLGFEPVDDLA